MCWKAVSAFLMTMIDMVISKATCTWLYRRQVGIWEVVGGVRGGGRNCAFLVCLNYFFERNQIKTMTLIMKVKNGVCNFWQ